MARGARRRIPDYSLYGEAPRGSADRLLHVETIEARSLRHHWRIDTHMHRGLHQLLLVQRGRAVARTEGGVAHFGSPAFMIVPAAVVHSFEFEPGTLGFVVTLADVLLREAAQRDAVVAALFDAPLGFELDEQEPATAALVRAFRALAREHAGAGPARALALEGQLAVLLAAAFRAAHRHLQPADPRLSGDRELVARLREAIEKDFRSGRSVPEYARALRVSEARLRQSCLRATGHPPIRLVHARALLEAKRQLVYTQLPVAEIAYALGFGDPAYFTRFFTRRTGVSPRAYRRGGHAG